MHPMRRSGRSGRSGPSRTVRVCVRLFCPVRLNNPMALLPKMTPPLCRLWTGTNVWKRSVRQGGANRRRRFCAPIENSSPSDLVARLTHTARSHGRKRLLCHRSAIYGRTPCWRPVAGDRVRCVSSSSSLLSRWTVVPAPALALPSSPSRRAARQAPVVVCLFAHGGRRSWMSSRSTTRNECVKPRCSNSGLPFPPAVAQRILLLFHRLCACGGAPPAAAGGRGRAPPPPAAV